LHRSSLGIRSSRLQISMRKISHGKFGNFA
jgi:hypothetical protein